MKEVPKYHETFIPILKTLAEMGDVSTAALKVLVAKKFYGDLPKDLLEQRTKSGHILILNRIGWGKAYLKQAGMIEQPERALVRITDKGREVLRKGKLSLKEIKSDPEFQAHQKTESGTKVSHDLDETATPQDQIDAGFNKIENQVKTELLAKLKTIDPFYFQKVILTLLEKMGYGDLVETPKTGDGGIDGIITQDKLGLDKIYIQAKRFADSKVRESDIRDFIGAMSRDTNKGIFVTTSKFDQKALSKAKDASHKIITVDGDQLADLMYTYGVGVQVTDTYEVKQLDEDFFEQA